MTFHPHVELTRLRTRKREVRSLRCHRIIDALTFLLNSKFVSLQIKITMQPYFLAPGTYPYAGRKSAKALHVDDVNHIMVNVFSSVLALQTDIQKREERKRVSYLAWETFMDKNRAIICPRLSVLYQNPVTMAGIVPIVHLLKPINHSNVNGVSVQTNTSNEEMKHHRNCNCIPCVDQKDKLIAMQEQYLTEQGQDPNSQEANASMLKLLGNCNGNVLDQIPTDATIFVNTPVIVRNNSSAFDGASTQPIGFSVPQTPFTGKTDIENEMSPRCASTPSYMYSPSQLDLEDAELTQTDEEFIRDEPISILEIPQIYAEGVQHDGHNSDENNRTKRARVTPLALKYSA